MADFDGCLALEVEMLAQVDGGLASLSQETKQAIVAELLSNAVDHVRASFAGVKTGEPPGLIDNEFHVKEAIPLILGELQARTLWGGRLWMNQRGTALEKFLLGSSRCVLAPDCSRLE